MGRLCPAGTHTLPTPPPLFHHGGRAGQEKLSLPHTGRMNMSMCVPGTPTPTPHSSHSSVAAQIGFLTGLWKFPVALAGNPVEALADFCNGEMTMAVDTIAPKHPLS